MRTALLITCLATAMAVAHALTISNTLGDDMVLQRDKAIIWGWIESSDAFAISDITATIVFLETGAVKPLGSAHGVAGDPKRWQIDLSYPAGGPYDILIFANHVTQAEAALKRVLFGDVFLCGGQSNMQFTVDMAFNAAQEKAQAANFATMRLFTVGDTNTSTTPLQQLDQILQPWTKPSAQVLAGDWWHGFSAVCWMFGRELWTSLGGKVPVGLVSNNWGGTSVQAWSSPDALARCKSNAPKSHRWNSNLYNAMINPFLPMRLKGFTWYQAEQNTIFQAGDGPANYECAFPAMVTDWRKKFDADLWFGFMQLAPWVDGNLALPEMRLAQQRAADVLPNVFMAVAMDDGDITSPFLPGHPRNKTKVAHRLALGARRAIYKQNVQDRGPQAIAAQFNGSGTVLVRFEPETIGKGLQLRSELYCPTHGPKVRQDALFSLSSPQYHRECLGFQLMDSYGAWRNATGRITGRELAIIADSDPAGEVFQAVRYAFSDYPATILWNKDGLPAPPFLLAIQE